MNNEVVKVGQGLTMVILMSAAFVSAELVTILHLDLGKRHQRHPSVTSGSSGFPSTPIQVRE